MFVPGWFGFERSWIARGLKAIAETPDLFSRGSLDNAQRVLCLGNQQVFALEHWLQGLGLIARTEQGYVLTNRSRLLAEYDPQIEESGTWYAIHYWLATNKEYALSYWCAANSVSRTFSREQLQAAIAAELPDRSEQTYANHIRVLMAIIKATPIGKDLGLFRVETGGESITTGSGGDVGVPEGVLAYAISDWARRRDRTTASIGELEQSEGPATVLFLSRKVLDEKLDRISERYSGRVLWVSRTAGLNSIGFAPIASLAVLRAYYMEHVEGIEPLDSLKASLEKTCGKEE